LKENSLNFVIFSSYFFSSFCQNGLVNLYSGSQTANVFLKENKQMLLIFSAMSSSTFTTMPLFAPASSLLPHTQIF
jgi:hypothetical protein